MDFFFRQWLNLENFKSKKGKKKGSKKKGGSKKKKGMGFKKNKGMGLKKNKGMGFKKMNKKQNKKQKKKKSRRNRESQLRQSCPTQTLPPETNKPLFSSFYTYLMSQIQLLEPGQSGPTTPPQTTDYSSSTATLSPKISSATAATGLLNSDVIKLAKRQNNAMQRRFSTRYSQYTYKTGQLEYLSGFVFYLVWIYFLLSAFYVGILFFGSSAVKFTIYYKIAVLLGVILFPYLATPAEMFLLKMGTYITETTIGNVFKRPDYEYVVDYNSVPNLFSY